MEPAKIVETLIERHELHVEGYAIDFITDEVGRFNCLVNWEKYKIRHPDLIGIVKDWMDYYEIDDVTPEKLLAAIEYKAKHPGKWL